jgi:hypothetical protein
MSVVQGTIQNGQFAGQIVDIDVPTVRVPELPQAEFPQGTDLLVLYQEEGNKTTQMSLDNLRMFMVTGGDPSVITPVINGADVEIVITAEMAEQSRVNVPVLANKMFGLRQRGVGDLLQSEYDIIPSGGFELNPKNEFGYVVDDFDPNAIPQLVHEGDVFIAHVYDWENTGSVGGSSTTSLFTGKVNISTDTALTSLHRQKLIQATFGSAHGTITLEDLNDAPANSIVCIATLINNSYQTKIAAKNGQKIYYNNTSLDYIWLGISETLWLYRGDDGWYVLNQLPGVDNVGDEFFGRKQKPNTLIASGELVLRADYPRLWEYVQSLGFGLVSDATWNTVAIIENAALGTRAGYKPYEGCYSMGDGATTFRLPNMQEKFVRGLNNIGGSDSQRVYNHEGGVQPDDNRRHDHDQQTYTAVNDGGRKPVGFSNTLNDLGDSGVNTGLSGGYESRPINVGLLPLIRI